MVKVINVVGAIIIKNNKILCAQRGEGRALSYKWEFPGGKIEENETSREALVRELNEELKLEVSVEPEPFECTTYDYDFGTVTLTTFCCEIVGESEPVLTEHVAVKWLAPSELTELDWAPADVPAVEKLMMTR